MTRDAAIRLLRKIHRKYIMCPGENWDYSVMVIDDAFDIASELCEEFGDCPSQPMDDEGDR